MSLQERKPPPRAREPRILAHPFEVATGCLFLTSATSLAKAQAAGTDAQSGILAMPDPVVWAWVVSLIVGALAMIVGLLIGAGRNVGRGIEAAGLYLGASAWTTLGLVMIGPAEWLGWLPVFIVGGGCVLRLLALRRLDRVAGKVAEARRDGDEP